MNFHIVKSYETLEKIAIFYNLDPQEIINLNPQIRIWTKLVPGMKLKLPEISERLKDEIEDVEPFIEDYYPKANPQNVHNKSVPEFENTLEKPVKEEVSIPKETQQVKPKANPVYPNYYPPYYYPLYPYYNNYQTRYPKKKKKL